jgi:RNA polymerase sigma-70 factor (sigma-E family)
VPRAAARESFEEYVRARNAALSRIAYLLTGDRQLAQDLVQQTLLSVVARWSRIVAAGDPDPYVRRALYHQHISWWRRHRPVVGSAPPESELSTPDPGDAVATTLAVRAALAQLAPRQRAVLVLRYFEDLTETQTAQVLGISVGTVKSQARDALARLRAIAPELSEIEVQA